ncbi:MAG TPA: MBL fold metallo-hydrolase [Gemmataceae bacterium]|jgi:phosphoribosyl 1,2-cyclic phosphate phosphodiesterase|nr:MBL fold metallo-hydrolase [Gemmataceae bacterium]
MSSIALTSRRQLVFLGTGTSVGVPMLGCDCDVCRSTNPKNQRYRCSVLLQNAEGNLLVDTTPELRLQLLREHVSVIHAVLYTHYHADHLFGLDDVRPMSRFLEGPLPLYCTNEVEEKIRQSFSYAFPSQQEAAFTGYIPRLAFRRVSEDPFHVLGMEITPIPLLHAQFNVLGYRVADTAYCTDVNRIPDRSWKLLEGLDVLILDALRPKPHPAHFSLNEALEVIAWIKPKRAYLTHMTHEIDHESVSRQLPPNVELAYDGLRIEF